MLVPEIPGITYDLGVSAKDALTTSYAWRRDVGTNAKTIDVAAPFATTAPVDGATGVDLATPFISDGDGARTFVWIPNDTGPTISLTTVRSQVTMPDPSPLFVLPDGASYAWGVIASLTRRRSGRPR